MAGKTYDSKSGGKVWVKSTDPTLPDKDFAKESNRVGEQISKTMKAKTPGDATFFKHTIKDNK